MISLRAKAKKSTRRSQKRPQHYHCFRLQKRYLAFLLLWICARGALASPAPFTIVIDPGHGGSDLGAIYDNGFVRIAEKEITLRIAVQAARALRRKGFNVTLTRSVDREVPLSARTALANRLKADVFLSIHMNSNPDSLLNRPLGGPEGVETYILNHTSDATSKRLAYLENSHNRPNLPEGQEVMDVALILKDLTLDANTSESKLLACSIQKHLVGAGSLAASRAFAHRPRNRGVREALFHVLLGADMPSALVEAGFMTSSRDRTQVMSVDGRKRIGAAIAQAIDQYHSLKNSPEASLALSTCKVH